ncbi:CPBP family intramembrane glutamic endopeptidase [Bradyrhizobium aeschynomenes]|uniref:CPBP family intramembrane glutamic endopeptidase n=1 Tax=Bradyrhizobium aeschynomenes TaxID=2734909 RepID=UPI003221B51E
MREVGNPSDKAARGAAVAGLAAVLAPMIVCQVMRLHQHEAFGWIAFDYAGRLGALAAAAAIPAVRMVALRREQTRISPSETALWVVGLSLAERLCQPMSAVINGMFPGTVFGSYPRPEGWLNLFDLVVGLALVAVSEEIVFRRCVGHVLRLWLDNNRISIVLVSSILFGVYHWWTGLGNVTTAALVGAGLAVMLQRSVALWPVILAHYLIDLVAFA